MRRPGRFPSRADRCAAVAWAAPLPSPRTARSSPVSCPPCRSATRSFPPLPTAAPAGCPRRRLRRVCECRRCTLPPRGSWAAEGSGGSKTACRTSKTWRYREWRTLPGVSAGWDLNTNRPPREGTATTCRMPPSFHRTLLCPDSGIDLGDRTWLWGGSAPLLPPPRCFGLRASTGSSPDLRDSFWRSGRGTWPRTPAASCPKGPRGRRSRRRQGIGSAISWAIVSRISSAICWRAAWANWREAWASATTWPFVSWAIATWASSERPPPCSARSRRWTVSPSP
mmetsp:Transcript_16038/g.34935  ORF Transcript_16038/g.34935 Transcript_16038/m.34935 type:complete len:282 (-) Transcript_16038:558-1403(-)